LADHCVSKVVFRVEDSNKAARNGLPAFDASTVAIASNSSRYPEN
jgi:hypothetical protein